MPAKELELIHAAIESLPDEQKEAAVKAVQKVKNSMPPWAWGFMLLFSGSVVTGVKMAACPILCNCTPPAATAAAVDGESVPLLEPAGH